MFGLTESEKKLRFSFLNIALQFKELKRHASL